MKHVTTAVSALHTMNVLPSKARGDMKRPIGKQAGARVFREAKMSAALLVINSSLVG